MILFHTHIGTHDKKFIYNYVYGIKDYERIMMM